MLVLRIFHRLIVCVQGHSWPLVPRLQSLIDGNCYVFEISWKCIFLCRNSVDTIVMLDIYSKIAKNVEEDRFLDIIENNILLRLDDGTRAIGFRIDRPEWKPRSFLVCFISGAIKYSYRFPINSTVRSVSFSVNLNWLAETRWRLLFTFRKSVHVSERGEIIRETRLRKQPDIDD